MNPDTVQNINVKIFSDVFDHTEVVKVFHRWIKEGVCPELLIDVAEYSHVPAGPGVLLIAHEANYSMDTRENRPGLLYNRKMPDEGSFESKLSQAHKAALEACDRLEKETAIKFDRNKMEVFINDRILAPNNEETEKQLLPLIQSYFKGAKIQKVGEPRDLFRVAVG